MASKGPYPVVAKPSGKSIKTSPRPVAEPVIADMPAAAPVIAIPQVPEVPAALAASVVPETAAPAPVVPEAVAPAQPAFTAPAPVPESTPVAAPAAAVIEEEVTKMEATVQSAAEDVQAKAKTLFADVNDRTKTVMEKGSKMFEDFNDFSKGNVEALVESSKIAAKGVEAMGQDAAEYSRKQFESATAVLRSLSSVKSPTDFFKLQSDYVRSAFDSMVAETSKNTETMLKLAGEIAQPISTRVAVAAEKVKLAA